MYELIFVAEEGPKGGFFARALEVSIVSKADILAELPKLSISPLKFPERLPWLAHAAFFV